MMGLTRALTGACAVAALLVFTFSPGPVRAAGEAPKKAKVEKWASGLKAPHGIAQDPEGRVYVVEGDAGQVTRLTRDGKKREVFAKGLKSPSFALISNSILYVSERKGDSVAQISPDGKVERLSGQVSDPLGLALDTTGHLLTVSHQRSAVVRFSPGGKGTLAVQEAPVVAPPSGEEYGWRDLAAGPGATLYITDEEGGSIYRQVSGGKPEEWVKGLDSPAGLLFAPSGLLYVTEEGKGGRLSSVTPDGKVTLVAEKLGKARDVLLLEDGSLLVTDRGGGIVWRVTPQK
jgi:glucose/arabinose dehydrogenase